MAKPHQVTIRAYQVGFGDCFLLTFHYGKDDNRHVLIDFGSTAPPRWSSNVKDFDMGAHMVKVAEDIAQACGGHLHAVVATHRHKDHISGFATLADGTGSGDVIRGLDPDLVIQPWTENPAGAPDATGAVVAAPGAVSAGGRAFVAALGNMHAVSQALLNEVRRRAPELRADDAEAGGEEGAAGSRSLSKRLAGRLAFMGENNLANRSAVENLMTMGKERVYVNYGSERAVGAALRKLLPGVKVRILGPPTIEQSGAVQKQRQRDDAEFWHLQALASRFADTTAVAGQDPLFPGAATCGADDVPRASRWLRDHMRALRGQQLYEIVRILDKAMNNTSVILLFEVGKQKLLFPGDAQIENWSYALDGPDKAKNRKLLSQVTFYKVGHHGSLNATPRTLWNNFAHRCADEAVLTRLQTLVSTREGKHGSPERNTEVPRKTLVEALAKESRFFTTQSLKSKQLCAPLEIPL